MCSVLRAALGADDWRMLHNEQDRDPVKEINTLENFDRVHLCLEKMPTERIPLS